MLEKYVMRWAKTQGVATVAGVARLAGCTEGAIRAAFLRGHCSRRMARDIERASNGKLRAAKLLVGFAARDAA